MDQAVRLIKVYRLDHVGRNEGVVLPELGNAIDLNCQQYGNSIALQVAGEHDGGSGSPAMAKKNDVSVGFFIIRQPAVAVGIELSKHRLVRLLPVTILEDFHVRVLPLSALDALC